MARGYFKEFAISPDDWPASIRQVGTELLGVPRSYV